MNFIFGWYLPALIVALISLYWSEGSKITVLSFATCVILAFFGWVLIAFIAIVCVGTIMTDFFGDHGHKKLF